MRSPLLWGDLHTYIPTKETGTFGGVFRAERRATPGRLGSPRDIEARGRSFSGVKPACAVFSAGHSLPMERHAKRTTGPGDRRRKTRPWALCICWCPNNRHSPPSTPRPTWTRTSWRRGRANPHHIASQLCRLPRPPSCKKTAVGIIKWTPDLPYPLRPRHAAPRSAPRSDSLGLGRRMRPFDKSTPALKDPVSNRPRAGPLRSGAPGSTGAPRTADQLRSCFVLALRTAAALAPAKGENSNSNSSLPAERRGGQGRERGSMSWSVPWRMCT